MPDSDCLDYGNNNSNSTIYSKNEIKKVKGKDCLIVYQENDYAKSKHYFSKNLKINPDIYLNHKAYQWDELMKNGNGGLVLRSEHSYKDYTLIMEFDEIKEEDPGMGRYENRCK